MNRAARRKLKAPPHISPAPPPQPQAIQECHQSNKLQPVWTYSEILRQTGTVVRVVFVYGLAFLGGISVLYDFSPKISVSPYQLLDGSDPFSAPFIIANEGYLTLQNVSAICSLEDIQFQNKTQFNDFGVLGRTDVAAIISPGEKMTVKCRLTETFSVPSKLATADILIVVKYSSLWERTRSFRFVTAKGADGSWHWLPQPINK